MHQTVSARPLLDFGRQQGAQRAREGIGQSWRPLIYELLHI